ncbi:hypothetical protein LWI28_021719 [Acer negundo]|uniref:Uncharacterized protein n=1 Tax=Acer negundo TaxID=4023 RepID=A0AAD5IJ30_ACENE|nr:hypothetical protein LWI28_021719 [Acer negundo]
MAHELDMPSFGVDQGKKIMGGREVRDKVSQAGLAPKPKVGSTNFYNAKLEFEGRYDSKVASVSLEKRRGKKGGVDRDNG